MSDLVVKISGDPSGAVKAMADVSGAASDFASSLVEKLASVTAGVVSLRTAFEGVHAGILKADEIRDLQLSLDVFTGSVEKGTQAMRFFEEQASRTRFTATELAATFRDILPLASSRGFDSQGTEALTVLLSQLATVAGTDLSSMESGLQRLMSGGGGGGAARNPLARVLGLTKEDLKDLDFQDLIDKIINVSQHAEEFGQSFESASHKIHDAWSVAFGEGFDNALDNSRKGYQGMLDSFTNPAMIAGITQIGAAAANTATQIMNAAQWWATLMNGGTPQPQNANITPAMQSIADLIVGNNQWVPWGSGSSPTQYSIDRMANRGGGGGGWSNPPDAFSGIGPMQTADDRKAAAYAESLQALKDQADAAGQVAQKVKEAADSATKLKDAFEEAYKLRGIAGFPGSGLPSGILTPEGWGPGFTQSLPGGSLDQGALGLAIRGFSFPFMQTDMTGANFQQPADTFAEKFIKALGDGFRAETFQSSLAGAFVDLFSTGGKNIGQIFAGAMRQNVASMFDSLQKNYLPHVDPNTGQLVDSRGNPASSGQEAALAGLTGVEIGFAGYQAGYSGTPGARTGGVVGGAVAGAGIGTEIYPGIGTVVGAVVGAVIGAVGGMAGAAARQADYQYGVPDISAGGIASLGNTKNLTPAAIAQITTQIQQEYDAIHGGLIDLLLKFPNVAIPSFDEINGKFQDNPSAHWGEHLQQWITGTLPKEMLAALGDELATGFEQLGMSKEGFGKIFDFLKGVDPKQAIQDMSDLATALSTLFAVLPGSQSSIMDFFHGTNVAPDIFGKGSNTFQTGWGQIQTAGRMTPGQQIAGQYDSQILKDAAALNAGGLSPEEQIKYVGEISSLMKQRYDAEKQAIQQIFDVAKSLGQTAEQLISQYTVQGMVGVDGKPNYGQISGYYQGQSNQDLLRLRNSQNASDVDYWTRKFYTDIGATEQAGISGGGNVQDWSKWAADQVKAGTALAQAQLQAIGQTINTTNDLLNSKLDPALLAFLDGTDKTADGLTNVTVAANNAVPVINQMTAAMQSFIGAMAAAGFSSRTVQQRLAA